MYRLDNGIVYKPVIGSFHVNGRANLILDHFRRVYTHDPVRLGVVQHRVELHQGVQAEVAGGRAERHSDITVTAEASCEQLLCCSHIVAVEVAHQR